MNLVVYIALLYQRQDCLSCIWWLSLLRGKNSNNLNQKEFSNETFRESLLYTLSRENNNDDGFRRFGNIGLDTLKHVCTM